MPSIPQSLLWISLVVLWLFVLVPMLISKRDAVRRTSDVALATRVLNTGVVSATAQARGPAPGHNSDPDWRPIRRRPRRRPSTTTRTTTSEADEPRKTRRWGGVRRSRSRIESDYLDVDVIEWTPARCRSAPPADELTLIEEPEETRRRAERSRAEVG